MQDDNIENVNSPNDAVDADTSDESIVDIGTNDTTQTEPVNGEDDVEWYKKQNKKLFERAKTAEGFVKNAEGVWVKKPKPQVPDKPAVPSESQVNVLSSKDLIALNRANVHEDDVEEVMDFAKFKKISVSEALKTDYIKTTLRDNKEKRKSAEVAHTGGTQPSSSKPNDDQILANAEKGIKPKSSEEWNALHRAREALKK